MTEQGLDALFDSAPLTIQTNPDRLGLPVLGSLLSGVGVSPWRLMYVTAAVSAAVVACSAWGLARAVREPRWAGPIYAVAVVSSIPFAFTSRAYLDNTFAEGMLIAVAATALLAAERRGATLAGVVLLGGTLVMHWPTGILLVGVLVLFTVGLAPSAWADRGAGKPLTATGAARVAAIAVGGFGVGGIQLLFAPGANTPTQGPGTWFRLNVERLLPDYRLHLALPLAGVGAAALAILRPTGPRRRALIFSAVWLLPLGVAALAFAQDRPIPLMRFFGTALALPLLGAAAFVALIAVASRVSGVTALNVVAALVATALVGTVLWGATMFAADNVDNTTPSVMPVEIEPIRLANAFVDKTDAPAAIFVVDGPTRSFRRIRMLARGSIADRLHVFPGTPAELFERAAQPDAPSPDEISDEGFGGRAGGGRGRRRQGDAAAGGDRDRDPAVLHRLRQGGEGSAERRDRPRRPPAPPGVTTAPRANDSHLRTSDPGAHRRRRHRVRGDLRGRVGVVLRVAPAPVGAADRPRSGDRARGAGSRRVCPRARRRAHGRSGRPRDHDRGRRHRLVGRRVGLGVRPVGGGAGAGGPGARQPTRRVSARRRSTLDTRESGGIR